MKRKVTAVGPIKSETDYNKALAELEAHFVCEPRRGTRAAVRFNELSEVVSAYEAVNWPIAAPDGRK